MRADGKTTVSPQKLSRRKQRNLWEQGVGEAEQAQATDNDYAAVARGWDEYVSLAEEAIFEYAFRLGARLTMEVQSDINE